MHKIIPRFIPLMSVKKTFINCNILFIECQRSKQINIVAISFKENLIKMKIMGVLNNSVTEAYERKRRSERIIIYLEKWQRAARPAPCTPAYPLLSPFVTSSLQQRCNSDLKEFITKFLKLRYF